MIRPAILADAMLDGASLASVPANEWGITARPDGSEIVALAGGGRRAFHRFNGSGRPLKEPKYDFTIAWEHLSVLRDTIHELLAVPGLHRLILWREETYAIPGNGSRVEFELPRTLALDEEGALDVGVDEARLRPRVKVQRTGPWLTFASANAVDYAAAATADAGEVLFLEAGQTFKLPAAPAIGEVVYVHAVPVYLVLEGAAAAKRLPAPLQEPLVLTLVEA